MGKVFDRCSPVMLGLDPSIQGDRPVACPWTLATSARVTVGEAAQAVPGGRLSSRHLMPGPNAVSASRAPMGPGVKPRDDTWAAGCVA